MSRTRISFDPEFKLQLVLEVLQGNRVTDVARHDIHYSFFPNGKVTFRMLVKMSLFPVIGLSQKKTTNTPYDY